MKYIIEANPTNKNLGNFFIYPLNTPFNPFKEMEMHIVIRRLQHNLSDEQLSELNEQGYTKPKENNSLFSIIVEGDIDIVEQKAEDGLRQIVTSIEYDEKEGGIVFKGLPKRMSFFAENYIKKALTGVLYKKKPVSYTPLELTLTNVEGWNKSNPSVTLVGGMQGYVHVWESPECDMYNLQKNEGLYGILLEMDGLRIDSLQRRRLVLEPGIYHVDNLNHDMTMVFSSLDLKTCSHCNTEYLNARVYRWQKD